MTLGRILVPLALAVASPAIAGVAPSPGPGDPRIQSVVYDVQQVIGLSVALGYQLTLEFGADDRIENVAVGNAAQWQVTPNKSADRLFIKPMQGAADTNMSVATDARTYVFELRAASFPSATAPFLVRIVPPPAIATAAAPDEPRKAVYVFHGARALRPAQASDDGRVTTLIWSATTPLPAVYAIGLDGKESLINAAVRDGGLIIDRVAGQYILRRGGLEGRLVRRPEKARR